MKASYKILIGLGVTLAASLVMYGPMGFGRACVIGKTAVATDMSAFTTPSKS